MKHWIVVLIIMLLLVKSDMTFADVSLKKSNSDCNKNCSKTLLVGGKTFRYRQDTTLQISAIYTDIEWALVSVPVKRGKKQITYYYLHNSKSRKRYSTTKMCTGLDRDISILGEVVCITNENIHVIGDFSGQQNISYALLPDIKIAVIDHYQGGVINFAYISETSNQYDESLLEYQLNVNDLHSLKKSNASWLTTRTKLHKNSDFGDILAVNSRGDRKFTAAVYEWINAYNKALVTYNFDTLGVASVGKVNASELHNYGFEPRVEMTKQNVTFSALNSSSGKREKFSYSNSALTQMRYQQHEFAAASSLEFMLGVGFQPSFWHVNQTVDVADSTKSRTQYDMNTNTLTSYYVQGRWGDSQLAVSLLQNKAREKVNNAVDNKLLQEVLKEYVIRYDYHGIFSGASTLRLMYGSLNAGGIATYQVDEQNESDYAFQSKRRIYQALVMAEKGMYWGGYYSTYNSPSIVGFADKYRDYAGAAFDKDFRLSKYGMVIGYDEGWYGSRYETDYNRWYISGEVGIGAVRLHTNKQTLFDAVGTDEGDIHGKNTIELKGAIDVGYVWQRRIKSLKGLGMSVLAGYKWQIESLGQDPKDSENDEDDGWIINYQRQDILHGPYVKLNIIF